ncbi:MAG: hypothetical protein M3Y84_00310, partial [Acidobacteriota bacterium]|nr:hypothetical protein [Acidobacteriota bacterium]
MRSVPPCGSGWVRALMLNHRQFLSRTHPRGGTDVMKQAPPAVSGKLTALFYRRLKGGAMDTIY